METKYNLINIKHFLIICLAIFISSCTTTSIDQREIVPELFDPELKKGKIFIFSNHVDIRAINIRVNDEVRKMKHTETQIFDLKQGQNSLSSFMIFAGNEQENCDDQPYTFDTEMFPEIETYYFVIPRFLNIAFGEALSDLLVLRRCDDQVNEDCK